MRVKILDQLSQDFTQLLENEFDYNVVIEVGEQPNIKIFKAHSAILYQRSLYFRQKLTNATKRDNIVELKLSNYSVIVFDIIISGVISLENSEASDILNLLIAINEFKFTELVDHIQSYLIDNNASWLRLNFSRIYQISFDNENLKALQQFCDDILVKYPSMIFDSDDLDTLQENALISLLKRDDLRMEESEIWDKVIQWGKARTPDLPSDLEEWTNVNFKSLRTTLQHCLPHIRYFQIPSKDILEKIQPYQNILEKNLWVDILTKYLAPDKPITSLILTPRKKATVQLPPRKESIIMQSSSIITLEHAAEISSWIDRRSTIYNTTEIPYEFKLLLRGNRDGFSGEVFHKLCDNIPGTVVVVKINSTNEILGGYNPLTWKVSNATLGEYATTADSFIFSLKNENLNQSILSRVKNTFNALFYRKISYGSWFSYCDLGMGKYPNFTLKEWYCESLNYEKPIRNTSGWFFIDEYEVFQICKI
ncbi:hypothetical protein C2G38_2253853 [Gigaspora rosea]|uniref:TLD-domain-containing protein n=1 Tax=Gigaspora rosea TaxID=44941 RepID=A0A397UDD4_9GLOM|nr:hypothetical protein C2G38_2253853 [Gigaspora rosea]